MALESYANVPVGLTKSIIKYRPHIGNFKVIITKFNMTNMMVITRIALNK